MANETETKSPVEAFLAGETLWIKPNQWAQFGLGEAHATYAAAIEAARSAFFATVRDTFPKVPNGKTLEAFPGKFGSVGVKLVEPKASKGKRVESDLSALSVLLGPDKKPKAGAGPALKCEPKRSRA